MAWRADPEDTGFQVFLSRAASHPILTAQQERDLARRFAAGDMRAKERLVECNIRLVLTIAQHYQNKGLALPDLMQEGVLGLHAAVEKYDPELGFKFSTYATWWIRKKIQSGLATTGADTIRLPVGVKQRRGQARALLRNDPSLSIEQVAAQMEEPVELVREALAAAEVVTSMDQETWLDDGGGGGTLAERIEDGDADDPYEMVADDVPLGLLPALRALPELERQVLELRFGLNGKQPHSIGEMAAALDKPTHVIQATQRRALSALRNALLRG